MYLMLIEAGPALVSLLVLPFVPETPRFLLLSRGDRDQAEKGESAAPLPSPGFFDFKTVQCRVLQSTLLSC